MSFWNTIKNLRPQDIPRVEKVDLNLIKKLDELITLVGIMPVILSTYRTAEENAAVGGSSNSWHLQGKAVDLKFPGIDPLHLLELVKSMWPGGVGIQYPGGTLHLDTRPSGQYIFGEIFISAAKKLYVGFQEVLDLFLKKKAITIGVLALLGIAWYLWW